MEIKLMYMYPIKKIVFLSEINHDYENEHSYHKIIFAIQLYHALFHFKYFAFNIHWAFIPLFFGVVYNISLFAIIENR
jgi:hypothetical protein